MVPKWHFEPEVRNVHNPEWTRLKARWKIFGHNVKEPRTIEACEAIFDKALKIWIEGTEFRIVLVTEETFTKAYKKGKK